MNTSQENSNSIQQRESRTRYLYWWLLLALAFEYARPGAFLPGIDALKLNSLIPLGLLVVSAFAKGLRPAKEIFADPLTKYLMIYMGLIFFSIVHAEVTLYTFEKITAVLGYIFLFWIIARIAISPVRIRGIFLTLIIAHIFLLMMNPLVVLDPTSRHAVRGATFIGDGNDFALSLCILLPLGIDLALSARSKWLRLLYFGLEGIMLLAVIGTASRGATLALGAVAFYLWWRSPRKILALLLIAIVVLGILAYASDMYIERMATLANYQEEGSAQGRIIAWKAALQMARDHPILGVGAGQFPTSFGAHYMPTDLGGPMAWLTAHSMYFLVLGELGIPGLTILLIVVFGNMRANTRRRSALSSEHENSSSPISAKMRTMLLLLNAGIVGFATAGAFLSVAYYPHLFVVTALCVAARCLTVTQENTTTARERFRKFRSAAHYQIQKKDPLHS